MSGTWFYWHICNCNFLYTLSAIVVERYGSQHEVSILVWKILFLSWNKNKWFFLFSWETKSAHNSIFCSLWYLRKGKLWCLLSCRFSKCLKHLFFFFSKILKVSILRNHSHGLVFFFSGTCCHLRFAGGTKVRRSGRNTDYIP